MDAVISSVTTLNENKYTFKYSTVSDYITAISTEIEEDSLELETYTGDFMPIFDSSLSAYYSGFFSSRPNFKKLIKSYNSLVYTSNSLFSLHYFRKDYDLDDLIDKLTTAKQVNE